MNAIIVLAALLSLDPTPESSDALSVFNAQMKPYQLTLARHGDQIYEIAGAEERGFRVRSLKGDAALELRLFPEMGKVGEIVSISKKINN